MIYISKRCRPKEIDLIIQDGRTIYPVEIKMTARPHKKMASAFSVLESVRADDIQIGNGAVINLYHKPLLIDRNVLSIPAGYL